MNIVLFTIEGFLTAEMTEKIEIYLYVGPTNIFFLTLDTECDAGALILCMMCYLDKQISIIENKHT